MVVDMKHIFGAFVWGGCLLSTGCAPSGGSHKPVTGVGGAGAAGVVDFQRVRPIFADNCAACHPSRSGPDWLDYTQAQAYAKNGRLLRRAVTDKSMPPPGSPQAAAISDDERRLIGQWIAAGAPERAGAAVETSTADQTVAAAPALVRQCFQCHGPAGPGAEAEPKIPRLSGQNKDYLFAQLMAFKWRERIDPSNTMNDIASGLSASELEQTADYFSSQPCLSDEPPELDAGRRAIFERGRRLAENRCSSCHMNAEFGNKPAGSRVPLLAGQSEQYLINQTLYFRNRERRNELMNEYTRTLNNDDIAALALYFSSVR
jgi:cytochrome c553